VRRHLEGTNRGPGVAPNPAPQLIESRPSAAVLRRGEPVLARKDGPVRRIPVSWNVAVVCLLACLAATPAQAQLLTQHIKGTTGLKAGSQPPPHVYIPTLFYEYNTDTVRGPNGNRVPIDASINSIAYGIGIYAVTTKKVLGGFYAYEILFPVGANNRLQGTEIEQNPGAGITDSVVSPIQIGWHFKRADALASYSLFVPTGRYEDGAKNNTGFGMWGHEFAVGTTVYLDAKKAYHAATIMSFDVQSKKEDSETKVGNQINFEGGVGGDFLKGGLTVGLDYYAAFKVSDDQIEGLPDILVRNGKNKTFALGPEVSLALARKGMLYGFLKVNYQWETYARSATQGSELTILATFLVKPIKLPGA
jgi:hypothetical protein